MEEVLGTVCGTILGIIFFSALLKWQLNAAIEDMKNERGRKEEER